MPKGREIREVFLEERLPERGFQEISTLKRGLVCFSQLDMQTRWEAGGRDHECSLGPCGFNLSSCRKPGSSAPRQLDCLALRMCPSMNFIPHSTLAENVAAM